MRKTVIDFVYNNILKEKIVIIIAVIVEIYQSRKFSFQNTNQYQNNLNISNSSLEHLTEAT